MRVLLIADFYPPHMGGVELQVQALGRELVARGHSVDVATVAQVGLRSEEDDQGVAVHRFRTASTLVPWFSGNASHRFHPPIPDPLLSLLLRRLIRRRRPDAILTHGWSSYSTAAACLGQSVPLVLSVRDYGFTCATRNMLLNGSICSGPAGLKCLRHATATYGPAKGVGATVGVRLGRWLLRRKVTAVHVVSRHVGTVIERDLLQHAPRPIETIADIVLDEPVDGVQRPSDVRDRLPDRPYILFVGALQAHKGLVPLLAAYAQLRTPPPLVLIGTSWPDTPKSFPPGVTVIADVSHAGVMEAWQRALFGVTPSIWPDPLPGVVREAMIAGRPVIGSSVGGIVDLISHEEDGLLVPPGDVPALAAAMQRLLDDPDLTQRLGARARETAALFTGSRIAGEFERLFSELQVRPGRPSDDDRRSARDGQLPSVSEVVDLGGDPPERVHIVGGSGTGKSTLARAIGRALGADVHHLDEIAAISPGAGSGADRRSQSAAEIALGQRWVTEGIHAGWTDDLFRRADVIVWLDDVGAGNAAIRVSRRFVAGWLAETRRTGVKRIIRPRTYARHLTDYARSVGEIRRYRAPDAPDPDSREASRRQLEPYRAKVAHIRSRRDREHVQRWIADLQQRNAQPARASSAAPAVPGD